MSGLAPRKKFVLGPATRRGGPPRIDYEGALNPEQLAAVCAPPGPVLVIAGAGTGKTRAITYRVAWLLETCARPEEILLLTFTNKAAREMMSRVESLLPVNVREIWGGTFHHVAHRILRKHAGLLGYAPGFTILDREDARALLRAASGERRRTGGEKRFPQAQVLEAIHSLAVNTQEHAARVIAARYPQFLDRTEAILEVLRSYEERKRRANAMDYDDLLWNWLKLLQDSGFRDSLRARFAHVLVDEYQDTNRLQGEIVDLLCRPAGSVTVVGDDAQAIYSWRGATAENILGFPSRYEGARVFKLETNYRSTPEVLELANRAIAANPRRFDKNLRPSRPSGLRPEVVPCRDAFQQARFVAERILKSHEAGVPLEQIAVLYRAHWNALELQLELQRRDVPFRVRGGLRFFEQAHVKDATAFLRAVENPRDELAWLRVLVLVPGVGEATARAILKELAGRPDPLAGLEDPGLARIVGPRAREGFARFAGLLGALACPEMRARPGEMIRRVVDEFYGDYLSSRFPNARTRREDLAQLALYAAQFDSCEAFLAELALSGVVEAESSPVGPEELDRVTLSTVHQAKGLEWPVVFVIWLADGRFPTDFAGRVPGGYEEERRLFHVAVTRARDELVLTYPITYRWRGQDPVLMKRSRFLAELDEPYPPPYDVVEIEEPAAYGPEPPAARLEAQARALLAAGGDPAEGAPPAELCASAPRRRGARTRRRRRGGAAGRAKAT